jgi:hypothetical protein
VKTKKATNKKTPSRVPPKAATHFKQIPVTFVKKIAGLV